MDLADKHQKIKSYFQRIESRVRQNNDLYSEKYIRLGSKTVKLICYSEKFIPFIETQLSYSLTKASKNHDATIVIWNETEPELFAGKIIDNHTKTRMRLDELVLKTNYKYFEIFDEKSLIIRINKIGEIINHFDVVDPEYSMHNPIIRVDAKIGIINAYDQENNIYYYGVKDLHPEEFIKQGHIFVQIFNKIAKSSNSHLVHGAVVGLNNKGVLLCARGQRGKSTLAVLSMIEGFDYVSDDYLILENEKDGLYSYPIYSIVTLSPKMYNELNDDLEGKFVSNNARKDKYVIDVKSFHNVFRDKYPIKVCIFPQIVDDEKPSIVPCQNKQIKGRAITQLVHSTIIQLEDKHDIKTIKKLVAFVKDFEFYQINLCSDIRENVECLKQFCNQLN